MPDEVVREFPLGKGHRGFTSEYQPAPGRAGLGRRMQTELRRTFLEVFDDLGARTWLKEFVLKNDENARVYVNGLLRMMPLEIQQQMDATLVVKVISQVGPPTEVDLSRGFKKKIREDVVTPPALPAVLEHDRAPREPA